MRMNAGSRTTSSYVTRSSWSKTALCLAKYLSRDGFFLRPNHEQLTVNTNHEQSTVNTNHEQLTVNTNHEQLTVNTNHEQLTVNTNHEQLTVNTNHEQLTVNTEQKHNLFLEKLEDDLLKLKTMHKIVTVHVLVHEELTDC